MDLPPGARFPDLDLPDHTGRLRALSEVSGGDPVALFSSRGWWCPKEQRYLRTDRPGSPSTRSSDALEWWIPMLGAELVCFSTFAIDASLYGGAVTVARSPELFAEDPFARIFPGTLVDTGLFSVVPTPPGPVIERYAAVPWPGGGFG